MHIHEMKAHELSFKRVTSGACTSIRIYFLCIELQTEEHAKLLLLIKGFNFGQLLDLNSSAHSIINITLSTNYRAF